MGSRGVNLRDCDLDAHDKVRRGAGAMTLSVPRKVGGWFTGPCGFLPPERMAADNGPVPSLDGLRAVSIVIVMLSHFVDRNLFPGGFGVLLFFVISGFLITRLLFAELKSNGRILIANFYVRRILRLYPALLTYVIVICVVYQNYSLNIDFVQIVSVLFYFANYYYSLVAFTGDFTSMPFSIFWSLAIEEHFYIVFPLLAARFAHNPIRFGIACGAVAVSVLLLRIASVLLYPGILEAPVIYFQTQFRIDSLLLGVLLATLCEVPQGRAFIKLMVSPKTIALALVCLLISFLYRDPFFRETVRYSIQSLSSAIILASVVFSSRYNFLNSLLNSRIVEYIGRMSYSLYIWHFGVLWFLSSLYPVGKPYFAVVGLIASFAVAQLSYSLIERPFFGLRRKFGSHPR